MLSTESRIKVVSNPEALYRDAPDNRHVGVMFVDLDHFMRICIDDPPQAVFSLLSDFQSVVTDLVSSFKGELNSYQGDGVLAIFADAADRADCATRTLRCAQKILAKIQSLSHDHFNACGRTISVSIGLQFGQTWSSTLHTSRSFGPTLIGDAVNVAARLERQAQALDTMILVGDELIKKAWSESGSMPSDLAPFANVGPLFVHGRRNPVHVWKLQSCPGELLLDDPPTQCVDADVHRLLTGPSAR